MIEFGQETKSSGEGTGKNYFIETVKIVTAELHYNETQKWRQYPDDLGVTLTLDIGKDFNPNWYLGGSYKKDATSGEIVGWSTVWSGVGMLFRSVGMPIKCPKGQTPQSAVFPAEAEQALVGKSFCRLKYRSSVRTDKDGNPKWVEWNNTDKTGQEIALEKRFLDDITKGYVKDFLDPSSDTHPLQGAVVDKFDGAIIDDGLPV